MQTLAAIVVCPISAHSIIAEIAKVVYVETIVLVNLAMEIIRAHRLMGIIADLILE
jgi:hypothetical protein